jgi:hypothetical protein
MSHWLTNAAWLVLASNRPAQNKVLFKIAYFIRAPELRLWVGFG